jgi:predicted GNAT superfamily acetyltransferase
LPEPYRAAVYYAPERHDPLWTAGCTWLGADPETGFLLRPQPAVPGIAAATTDPRRYGFHATLKPPMRLRGTFNDFLADVETLVRRLTPFKMPRLRVADDFGFLALLAEPSAALDELAAACVTELDIHRLPESAAEQAKRAVGRTESERRNLSRWGYPYVLQDWRFHMTLSNTNGAAALLDPARRHFAEALDARRSFESLAIYVEPAPGENFRLVKRLNLGPQSTPPTPSFRRKPESPSIQLIDAGTPADILQKLLALNNAHAKELSWLNEEKLARMIRNAFAARRIGSIDAFILAFDQDSDYDGENFAWFKSRYERFVYVDRIAVAAAARGQGLARRLYEDLFAAATDSGQHLIVCEVNAEPPNPESDSFHASFGFEHVGTATLSSPEKTVRYFCLDLTKKP